MHLESWQRNLVALWVAQSTIMIAFSFVFPFIPLYVQTLGVKDATAAAQWAGVMVAATAVSMAISQPIWGNLADRWGRKPMLVRSMAGGCIVTALTGLVTSPEQLLALRFLLGVVSGTVGAANALVATSTPKHRLGFALGLMTMAQFVGTSIGPLIGGLISDTMGYRMACYAAGALGLLALAVVVGLVHENFTPAAPGAPRPGVWAESRILMGIALFPALIGVVFLIQLGTTIVSPVLSLFVAELDGGANAATAAGLVLAGTGMASALSALILGRVSDRVGHTRILPICLLGAAISYFPQALVWQTWQLLLLRMLLGVFLGGLMPSANALLAERVPRSKRGAAFGLAGTAIALANAVGPLSAAGIATNWGIRAVFLATGGLFAAGCGWVGLTLRKRSVHLPQVEAPTLDPATSRQP